MKRIITLAATVALIIGMAATPSMAADVSLSADVASSYVWRGMTFNDGVVVQPSIDVAGENGFGVNVWGNFDIDDYDDTLDEKEFSEIDLTVSYGFKVGKLDIGAGLIEYLFPATDADSDGNGENFPATTELYVSLGMPIVGGLSTALDIYYDVDAVTDFSYAALSIAYAYDINDKLGLEVGASLGYAGEDWAKFAGAGPNPDGGLYDYSLSASLGYTINDTWSASAFVTYAGSADDDNLEDVDNGGMLDTEVYGGIGISYAFK